MAMTMNGEREKYSADELGKDRVEFLSLARLVPLADLHG